MYIRMYLRVYQSELYETRMMEEDEYQKQGKRTRERDGERKSEYQAESKYSRSNFEVSPVKRI